MARGPDSTSRDDLGVRRSASVAAVYWDIEDIQFHCRISRTTAWKLARGDGDFPSPVVLGPRAVVWRRVDVLAFMESKRSPDHYREPARRTPGREGEVATAYRPRGVRVRTQQATDP
ncbi:MAG: AlpA family phage regulatory protein [Actinobacteria bacterium]|nr:AlpA family phage regulatory protein [Actinomycetota bacterium]